MKETKISKTQTVCVSKGAFGGEFRFLDTDDRPYWKSNGASITYIKAEVYHLNGSLHVQILNSPEGGRGKKEAWVTMPEKAARQLLEFLKKKYD